MLLERLVEDIKSLQTKSVGTPQLKSMRLKIDVAYATNYFEYIHSRLLDHPMYDIDRGIDYGEWADFDGWESPSTCERIDEGNENVVIHEGLIRLHVLLTSINEIIKESRWDNYKYGLMVEDIFQKHKAPKKSLDTNFIVFNKWKISHRHIDENMYKRYLTNELLVFLKSDFLQYDLTEIDRDRSEAMFKDSGIDLLFEHFSDDALDELKRKYYKLRLLIDYHDGRFDFCKMDEMGFHIFLNRHKISENGIDEMVRFMQITEFIYEDMDKLDGASDAEELECPFCEEQIVSCGIKDAKKWLSVIESFKDELRDRKTLWVSVYSVLVSYKAIDDNVRGFCDMVKAYFGQKLDNSNISREWKKIKGVKIDDWETTKRNERRMSLAKEMSERYKNIK